MKLASLRQGGRDGTLVVVSRDLAVAVPVPDIAPTLQRALDDWSEIAPRLEEIYKALEEGRARNMLPFDPAGVAAPLPRAYQWADGSAYVHHVELVRKARGAELPESFWHDPLMYQGGSDRLLGPTDDIEVADEEFGIDFEAEVAVITDDVRMGTSPEDASERIRLFALVNDVSLRNLVPAELAKGFGFFQSKPASAFSPVAVTPDELGSAWDGKRLDLHLDSFVNAERVGSPNAAADMTFDLPTLVAHAARTRHLGAGTIVGSGTVANRDPARGSSCLAERRMLEIIEHGEPRTPFLRFGDRVEIEMRSTAGDSIFGSIHQRVVRYAGPGA